MKTVFVTGADRGVGFALCQCFLEHGWRVFAGQYMPEWKELEDLKRGKGEALELIPLDVGDTESVKAAAALTARKLEHLDMLVNCAGITGRADDAETLHEVMNVNTLGPLRVTEAFLPLMENGMKRLCFVSSEAGCVSLAHRTDSFAYCMSKRALNMEVKLMFNRLSGEGFTFRLYHPGWVRSYMMGQKSTMGNFEPEEAAQAAFLQFCGERSWEDVLAMTDVSDEIWPF